MQNNCVTANTPINFLNIFIVIPVHHEIITPLEIIRLKMKDKNLFQYCLKYANNL